MEADKSPELQNEREAQENPLLEFWCDTEELRTRRTNGTVPVWGWQDWE
jgi:hypothetical protein